ncbi:hypothetical protein N9K67_07135 [Opitutaceae bacterium]|nr:hypothetical protein [Opitutaceae bacterium]
MPHFFPRALSALILTGTAVASPDHLVQRAITTLTEVLEVGTPVDQIHAAEVLIPFGHSRTVWEHYYPIRFEQDDTPIMRITNWRALARVERTPQARQIWINKIFDIALTPGLPDRVHAAESAAKLKAPPAPHVVASMETWAADAPDKDAAFALWCNWSRDLPPEATPLIINWLKTGDGDTRLRVAYMLARLKPTDPAILAALADAANAAKDVDTVNTIVVSAAHFLKASRADVPAWRRFLNKAIATNDPLLIFHAVQGILPVVVPEDIPSFIPLLDHPAPDARTAAAWVILMANDW